MKAVMKNYVISKMPVITAHWEDLIANRGFIENESTENVLKIDLSKEMNVIRWEQEDLLKYEFALSTDIEMLFEYLCHYQIPYKFKISISSEEWRSLFNEQVNEMLLGKKENELRELIKFVEIKNN